MTYAVSIDRRLSVAPMMDWTDRHARFFLRLVTRRTLLYTEMLTAIAVLRGDRGRLLGFDPAERPLALQLAGADPAELAEAASIGEAMGYDEINLNVGCPSERVQNARFGACLMAEPETVARCVDAMRAAVTLPVTVKCRIGIDGRDSYDDLKRFVDEVAAAGCMALIIHARSAILGGLSAKQNREIPPLRHDLVYRLKQEQPSLTIILNGGVKRLDVAHQALHALDGVMMGRAAYQDPACLLDADRMIFGEARPTPSRHQIARAMIPYFEEMAWRGVPFYAIARHMLGLFNGLPGARAFRRYLSENGTARDAGPQTLAQALALVPERTIDVAAS